MSVDRFALLSNFVRVAETGSFSQAARDLDRSQSSVSQQVRSLEQHLGVRLIDRTTRRFSLTEAGTQYLQSARTALELIDEADASIAEMENSMSGRLSITAPVNFGTSILGGYVFEFLRKYPEIKLDVSLSDRFVDILAEGFDLAIRMGPTVEPSHIVRHIGRVERCLAAAPQYLDRVGRPSEPVDLASLSYVMHTNILGSGTLNLIADNGRTEAVHLNPSLRSDNSHMICEAIAAGVGIGLIHNVLLDPLVRAGQLERVLPDWRYEPQEVNAIYPSNRYIPRRVKVFVEGLATYLRSL